MCDEKFLAAPQNESIEQAVHRHNEFLQYAKPVADDDGDVLIDVNDYVLTWDKKGLTKKSVMRTAELLKQKGFTIPESINEMYIKHGVFDCNHDVTFGFEKLIEKPKLFTPSTKVLRLAPLGRELLGSLHEEAMSDADRKTLDEKYIVIGRFALHYEHFSCVFLSKECNGLFTTPNYHIDDIGREDIQAIANGDISPRSLENIISNAITSRIDYLLESDYVRLG